MTGKPWPAKVYGVGASDKPLHLDGQGHIVKNLVVTISGNKYGMFDLYGDAFSIKNIVFESPSMMAPSQINVYGGTSYAGFIEESIRYPITLENVGIVNADFEVPVPADALYLGGFFGEIRGSP